MPPQSWSDNGKQELKIVQLLKLGSTKCESHYRNHLSRSEN